MIFALRNYEGFLNSHFGGLRDFGELILESSLPTSHILVEKDHPDLRADVRRISARPHRNYERILKFHFALCAILGN